MPPTSPEAAVSKPFPNDRRRRTPVGEEGDKGARSLFEILAIFIRKYGLQDIFSTRHHSDDFIETRAGYIAVRLRYMAIFYSVAVPLWIPVDYLLLSPEHFNAMMVPKFLLTVLLLPLGSRTLCRYSNNQLHAIFALVFVTAGMFYFASMWILSHGAAEPLLAGYSLMPFMMISMLGVFPLTLAWGVAMSVVIGMFYLGLQAALGQLMTIDTANMLWVLFILAGLSIWVQSSQLLMLLKLYRESTRDPLTGLINRRVLMRRLTMEIAHVKEAGSTFSILMFDLDRFKRVNDNYGHLIGDKVLKAIADILQVGLREHDVIARFGGEEFVALLPGLGGEQAIAVAERMRARCHDTHVTAPNGDRIQLSTSVGVTEYEAGEAIEVTLDRVDESLYKAKELGRNRVVHRQSDGFLNPAVPAR